MHWKSAWTLTLTVIVFVAIPSLSQERSRSAEPVQLPEGDGKAIVEAACAGCHSLGNIANSGGHTSEEWKIALAMMLNVGAPVPKDKVEIVQNYLIKNFPEMPIPKPVVLPGNVEVSFKEWTAPTPGSRPHDPLAGLDGSLWYSGHMAGLLGRVDPKTGDIKEFHLKTPNEGPHGLIMDEQGNVWFTANFKGYIGKLNPKTGQITEYPLDPRDRDPHTPIFDHKGTIFFSVQGANMVGKLVMATGETKSVPVPTPKANPYGMVVTSKGIPYFVEFASNKIASIDPESLTIHEYVLPNAETRPRRVAISDDILYYGDYSRGYIGMFDTRTNQFVREWPSPGGPKSKPYAITSLNGIVWYSESGVKPNTLVRFDPKSEHFQSWAIPSGGGVVRNMMHTADGKLVLAESGVNVIALVTIKDGKKMAMK